MKIEYAPFITAIAPPTICRRCDDVIDAEDHTLSDCETSQQAQAIAADLAYNEDKANRLNNEAFARAMQDQINDKK